jgi:hypothetical protein
MATEPQVSTGTIATTSNPATPTGTVTVTAAPAEFNDTGTNAPVVTLQQSQTPPSTSGPIPYEGVSSADSGETAFIAPQTAQNATTGLSSADLGTTATIAQDPYAGISSADLGTTAFIAPQGKPAAAAAPADAGPTVPTSQNSKVQPGRNKFFTNDYYLDDVEIETSFATTAGGGVTNLSKIQFKITEPNGMTLLFNLNNAIRDLYNQPTAAINVASFVMVIRFYGWDEKGNLVTKVVPVEGTPGTVPNTSNAVVTKYFPFQLNKLTFKNASKAVDYHAEGTALNHAYAQSSALGSVPVPLQLVGETVEQVLNGTATSVTVSGDDSKRKTVASAPIKVKDMETREPANAGVDANGNFTGETTGPFSVVAP